MIPLLNALLTGFANLFAFVYALFQYIKPQTRINSATDGFLDLIAADFFGLKLQRAAQQSDASFRALIIANLLRERGTRAAIISVLTQLTGRAPIVIEPSRPLDTGVWDGPGLFFDDMGAWGDNLPFQSFVIAFRPIGAGVANVGAYDATSCGYDDPTTVEYVDPSFLTDFLTDADIFSAIESVRPIGFTIWARISS